MGIASKHAYRFNFLKSDKWQLVRTDALARDGAKCRVCGVESINNDAHHIYYRKRWDETAKEDLVTLCRNCHQLIHILTEPKHASGDLANQKRNHMDASEEFKLAKKILRAIAEVLQVKVKGPTGCMFCSRTDALQDRLLFPEQPFNVPGNTPRKLCQPCWDKLQLAIANGLFSKCNKAHEYWKMIRLYASKKKY